jgi:phosphatidylglycerol---prolipoprotein diacylglyceryl transferase
VQFPVHINFGRTSVSLHLICEIAAIFIGYRFYAWLRKQQPDAISDLNRLYIFMAVCAGALIGSRLIGTLENAPLFFETEHKLLYVFNNKTIVGGLLFGLFAVEGIKKYIGITTSSGDLMVYPILLGLIIGRVGCFCEGLSDGTIGKETGLFTGINFGDGIYRHPLPLYEIWFLLSLGVLIFYLNKKMQFANGGKFKLWMMSYFMYRFFIEFLKEPSFNVFHISIIQWTCLLGMLYYFRYFIHLKKLFQSYA